MRLIFYKQSKNFERNRRYKVRYFLCEKGCMFFPMFINLLPAISSICRAKVPILVYHLIDEYTGIGPKDLYVTPKNFEEQMKYLRNHGFTLLTFEQWQNMDKVKKPIFITFDDGWKDNLNAFAIFQKLKSDSFKPAGTIFVISEFIGGSNRLSQADLKRMSDSGFFFNSVPYCDPSKLNKNHEFFI